MTTTNLTRRTALLGTVTLPAALAPAAALAVGEIPQLGAAESDPDPFVSAFCRYVDAEEAYIRQSRADASLPIEDHEKEVSTLCNASSEAMLAMGETVPTTTLGLYLAICALIPVFGEPRVGGGDNLFSFEDMEVHDQWANGSGEALLRSLKEGAERILNNNHPEDV